MPSSPSLPKRTKALRVDSIVQALWLAVIAYQITALSSEGWNTDTVAAIHILLIWQMASAVLFWTWRAFAPRAALKWRLLALIALFSVLALLFAAALISVVVSLLSLSDETAGKIAELFAVIALPLEAAYLVLTVWEAWLARPATTSDFTPARDSTAPSTPALPQVSEVMKEAGPWLRFIIPTALLALSVAYLYTKLDEQIGGSNWGPAIVCAATLLVGWLFSLHLRRPVGPAFAIWSRLWWLACFMLLLLGLCCIPPIRNQLRRIDHARVLTWDSYPGPLGVAERKDLYSEKFGPELLRHPGLIEAHLEQYDDALSPYTDLRKDRHALALYFAALRLRGESLETISQRKLGLHLITAALLAEAEPAYWKPKAAWLFKELGAQPSGTFHMGLLDRATITPIFADWGDGKPLIGPLNADAAATYNPMTDDRSKWREQGRAMSLATGLVNVALRHQGLLSDDSTGRLLLLYQKHSVPEESAQSVAAAIDARRLFRHWANNLAKPSVRLELRLELDPAHFPYQRVQSLVTEKLEDFIRSCGWQVEWRTALGQSESTSKPWPVVSVKLVPAPFTDIPYKTRTTRTESKVRKIQRPRWGRGPGYDTRYETVTEYKTDEKSHRGPLTIPSLEVSFGDERIVLRPAGEVDRNQSEFVLDCLKKNAFPDSYEYTAVITTYYHMAETALSGWRYGTPTWSDPDSTLFWDNWDDVKPDSPVWN